MVGYIQKVSLQKSIKRIIKEKIHFIVTLNFFVSIVDIFNIQIKNQQRVEMKKILFPLEKLAISFFYFELLLDLDKKTYTTLALVLLLLSLKFEGARFYTPLLFIIVLLQYVNFFIGQVLLIIIVGLAAALFKVYDINVTRRGPYMMGHRYTNLMHENQTIQISIFYPTLAKGLKSQWISKKDYDRVLYQIFHVDPSARRIPYKVFTFIVSYIHKIFLPSEQMSPYVTQKQENQKLRNFETLPKQNKQKLIIFSHGLGSHLNAYSSIFYSWASQGYTILSINHDRDEVCVDHRKQSETDHKIIRDFLYSRRNRDLKIRVKQMNAVIQLAQRQNFMKEMFGVDIQFKQIILAGHSFGGGTVVATKASLNEKYANNLQKCNQIFNKIICLDPWFFPLQDLMYANLHNQNILIVNSQYFFQQVPYIYDLQNLFVKLKQTSPNIKAFMVKGMGHIAQCDMVYVFGNILKFTGSIKLYHLTDKMMELNVYMTQLFFDNKTKDQILEASNKFVRDKNMDLSKVRVLQQYRVSRELTFEKQKEKQRESLDIQKKL